MKTRKLQTRRRKTALPYLFVVIGVGTEVESAGKWTEWPLLLTSSYWSTRNQPAWQQQ